MFGMRFIKRTPPASFIATASWSARAGLVLLFLADGRDRAGPTGSAEEPFIVQETTANFQEVVQGRCPRSTITLWLARMMNLSRRQGNYASEDPTARASILHQVQVLMRSEIQALDLQAVLAAGENQSAGRRGAAANPVIAALSVEILGLGDRGEPKPETTRARADARKPCCGAPTRHYARRNAAVNRAPSRRTSRHRGRHREQAAPCARRRWTSARSTPSSRRSSAPRWKAIELEQHNRELVGLVTENARADASDYSFGIAAAMKAFAGADPIIVRLWRPTACGPTRSSRLFGRWPKTPSVSAAQHPAGPAARSDAPEGRVSRGTTERRPSSWFARHAWTN